MSSTPNQQRLKSELSEDTFEEEKQVLEKNKGNDKNGNLNEAMMMKDKKIISLENTIKKLELKNKQCILYEQAMIQSEDKCLDLENKLLKANETIREKNQELEREKKKGEELENHLKYAQKGSKNQSNLECISLKEKVNQLRQKNLQIQNELKEQRNEDSNNKKLKQENEKLKNERQNFEVNLRKKNYEFEMYKNQCQNQQILQTKKDNENMEKLKFQLTTLTSQYEFYHNRCQELQRKLKEYEHSENQWSIKEKNEEYIHVLDKYEGQIASMANKISSVQALQKEIRKQQEEKVKLQKNLFIIEEELSNKKQYIEILEDQLQEKEKNMDINNKIMFFEEEIQSQTKQIERLNAVISEKQSQLFELKEKYEPLVSYCQKMEKLQNGLKQIEQIFSQAKKETVNERQKNFVLEENIHKLQQSIKKKEIQISEHSCEISKLNRTISQKIQKIQFQKMEIQRLEKENQEKTSLSLKHAKLEKQLAFLQKQYASEVENSNQLSMRIMTLSLQIERKTEEQLIHKEEQRVYKEKTANEIQNLNKRITQVEEESKSIKNRIGFFELKFYQAVESAQKSSTNVVKMTEQIDQYDHCLKNLKRSIEEEQEKKNEKYDQIEESIDKWLKSQQDRLLQLKKSDNFFEPVSQHEDNAQKEE